MQTVKYSRALLMILAILVVIANVCGLFIPDFYKARQNTITAAELNGQDIVTLLIACTLCVVLTIHRKVKVFPVVLTGLLIYIGYTYAYFIFGLINTPLTLAYYLIVALSVYSLLTIYGSVVRSNNDQWLSSSSKMIGMYLIAIVFIVGVMEIRDLFMKTIGSADELASKHAYYALDLAFLFPGIVIAAIFCIRKRYIGEFFSGAFLIKTIALMPALIIADVSHFRSKGFFIDPKFDVIACVIMLSAAFMFYLYSRSVGSEKRTATVYPSRSRH